MSALEAPRRELSQFAPCNLSRAQIEEFTEDIVAQLELEPGGDLTGIVEGLGGTIAYENMLQWTTHDGSIEVRGPCDFTIRLPIQTSARRDRFTIAHELGHYFLHSDQGHRPGAAYRGQGSHRLEWEANWFAAGLLMPKDLFVAAWRTSDDDHLKVATQFRVSIDAALVRAKVLGL